MRKLYIILLFLIASVTCLSQSIVPRTNSSFTVMDSRFKAQYNLFVPAYADTTAANVFKGIDSLGAVIFTYNTMTLWVRSQSPKVWIEVGSGGGGGSGTVESVTGTSNRITITGTATINPVVDIAATYVGQTSITTLGTIATGVWNGTAVVSTFGGTGQTTVAVGDLLVGTGVNTWGKLTAGTATYVLTSNGAGVAPSWQVLPSDNLLFDSLGAAGISPMTTWNNTLHARRISISGGSIDTTASGGLLITVTGGGGSGLFPTTGTGTATGNVIGDLDGNTLTAQQGGETLFKIDGASEFTSELQSTDGTANGYLKTRSDIANGVVNFDFRTTNGTDPTVIIIGDGINKTLSYTATTHTFTGSVTFANLAGNGTGYAAIDNNGTISWTAGAGGAVSSVTGTANQITASPTTGAVTLSIPSVFSAPGTITSASTLTITSGGITVTAGGALITAGGLTVTAGNTTLTPLNSIGIVVNSAAGLLSTYAATNHAIQLGNATGQIASLGLGTAGQFLMSNGAGFDPSWSTPAGSGDVVKVGTPVNNQLGVWTGDGTLEGDANLTFASSTLNIGVAGTATGLLTLSGVTSGTITIQPASAAGTYTLTLPTTDGGANEFLQTNGSGVLTWAAGAGGGGITIGTTTITSGTNTRILYNNSGVVGEYLVTGTGTTAVLATAPSMSSITLAAGTATAGTAPLYFTSGTNLTVPVSGVMEFDGNVFYTTTASGRGITDSKMEAMVQSDHTLSDVNTDQTLFPAAIDTWTLQGNTTYEVEGQYIITNPSSASHTNAIGFTLGGGASITSMNLLSQSWVTAVNIASTASTNINLTTVTTTVTTAATTSTTTIWFKGTIRMNAGGTIVPLIKFSTAPGVTSLLKENSFISFTPRGSGTFTSVGNVQ